MPWGCGGVGRVKKHVQIQEVCMGLRVHVSDKHPMPGPRRFKGANKLKNYAFERAMEKSVT